MLAPGTYDPALLGQLRDYLVEEFERCERERRPIEESWRRYYEHYKADPPSEKTFPFPGCANLKIPLVATDVDIIYARLMSMLFSPQNLWTVQALRPDMVDIAPKLQEFLQWAQHNELDVYDSMADFVLEVCILGTGVMKTRYVREMRNVYEFREGTQEQQDFEQTQRMLLTDGPRVQHVPLHNFFLPAAAKGIDHAAWCGERLWLRWSELVNRQTMGVYQNVDLLSSYRAHDKGGKTEEFLQGLDGFKQERGDRAPIVEFWTDWDIDRTGYQTAVVMTIHIPSRVVLRVDKNPFFNQQKPYDAARYMRQVGRFYGIGLAQMLFPFQEEISTMHNQRIDNNTVLNAAVIVAEKTGNIKQGEPIFPGRTLLVDDVNEVKGLQLGVRADTTIPAESWTKNYSRERSGASEWMAGGDSPSTNYATATTATQNLREGAKRFDQVLREVRKALNSVGTKVLELYQQFNQNGKPYLVMGDQDGAVVEQVLRFPTELIRLGVAVDVTATSASFNKEIEVRTQTIILGQLQQFNQQLLQYVQLAINPQLPPEIRAVAQQAAVGGSIIMRRMLDNYGMQDTDLVIPDIREVFGAGQQQQLAQQGAQFGGGQPPQRFAGASGLAPVPQLPPGLTPQQF